MNTPAGSGLAAALIAVVSLGAQAQTTPDWTSVNVAGTAAMIAVDGSSNSVVASSLTGSTLAVRKLSPTGTTLWQRTFGPAGTLARATWVATDAAGNALVTGYLADSIGTAQGAVVLKYDAAGNLLWQDVTTAIYANALRAEADAAGNVYALSRTTQVTPGAPTVSAMHLTKYSPAGVLQWSRTYGASSATADSMVVSANGTVVVAGDGAISGQQVLAAFDTLGNPVWSSTMASLNPAGLARGPSGELVAVGTNAIGFLVTKYDAAFNGQWFTSVPARGGASRAAIDSLGNIVVSGSVDTNTGLAQVILYDWMTLKLAPNGALLWSQTYGQKGFTNEAPFGLAIGADDAIYVTGQGFVPSPVQVGANTPSTATVKYSPAGAQIWVANTTVASRGVGIKLSADGGVLVAAEAPQTVLRYGQTGLPNQAPTALASANPSAGTAPLTVAFSSAGSSDADGQITAYAWDFGDGQTSTAANPTHTYAAGQYTARLTVTDGLGASASAAPIVVTANAVAPPPTPVSLVLAKASVVGGTSTTATVTVSGNAGATVSLSSSNTNLVRLPASVLIAKGATSASFVVRTANVRRDTVVTLTARANGVTTSTALTLRR